MSKRTEKFALLLREEGQPGVFLLPGPADAIRTSETPSHPHSVERTETTGSKTSLTPQKAQHGRSDSGISLQMELKGSGTHDIEPTWGRVLRSCGFVRDTQLFKIPISSTVTDRFDLGFTVTGVTSGAKGLCVGWKPTGTQAGDLFVVVSTGTFQSGEVVQQASGSAGLTAAPVSHGICYRPTSKDDLTIEVTIDVDEPVTNDGYAGDIFLIYPVGTTQPSGAIAVSSVEALDAGSGLPSRIVGSLLYGKIDQDQTLFSTRHAQVVQDAGSSNVKTSSRVQVADNPITTITAGATTTIKLTSAHDYAVTDAFLVTIRRNVPIGAGVDLNGVYVATATATADEFTIAVDSTGSTWSTNGEGTTPNPISQTQAASLSGLTNLDGYVKQVSGLRGSVSISAEAGNPGTMSVDLEGQWVKAEDRTMPTGLDYGDTSSSPPKFQSDRQSSQLGGVPMRFRSVEFSSQNKISKAPDANEADGIAPTAITGRAPQHSITIDTPGHGGYPIDDIMSEGLSTTLGYQFGTVAGNTISVVSPALQISDKDDSDDDGTSTTSITLPAHDSAAAGTGFEGNDDVFICQL